MFFICFAKFLIICSFFEHRSYFFKNNKRKQSAARPDNYSIDYGWMKLYMSNNHDTMTAQILVDCFNSWICLCLAWLKLKPKHIKKRSSTIQKKLARFFGYLPHIYIPIFKPRSKISRYQADIFSFIADVAKTYLELISQFLVWTIPKP